MSSAREGVREKPLPAPTTGRSFPIGATLVTGGANFSVFSRSAASIELLFFDRVEDARPSRVIPIDPLANRTYHYWHVFVSGRRSGADLRIPGLRAVRTGSGAQVRSIQATARPIRPRRRRPEKL